MNPCRIASLQTRLLVMVLVWVTMVWLGAAVLIWADARHELDELLDGHLAQAAALLVVQQSRAEGDDDGVEDAPTLHKYAPRVAFQVFHEGQLTLRSSNAQAQPMSDQQQGFATVQLLDGSGAWRVFATRGAERDVQVYVAEQVASRNTILWGVLRSVLLPLLFALPLLALVLWWAVRQGLGPLRQLSQSLGQRQVQALEPVVLADLPLEMQPVVDALNALLTRMAQMLASERRFTADAAHELRTPIAAIRAQAQVAQGAGADTLQREHALQATLEGCDRATHLVDQLLTLARLEAPLSAATGPIPAQVPVDLTRLVQRVGADLAPAALARGQVLELDAKQPVFIAADEVLVGVLVRNLVDNALRYSPRGAQIRIAVVEQAGQSLVRVHDSGPGMTEPEMAHLGERFYRVLGTGQSGSGLGWSIVKRIVAVSGGQIQVSRCATLGGLCVEVRWPAGLCN